jgi:hypothetical protein
MGINNQSFSWEISLLSILSWNYVLVWAELVALSESSNSRLPAGWRTTMALPAHKLLALAAELEQQLRGLDEWAAVSWRHRLEAAERSSGRHDRCVDLIGITNFCVGLVLLANYIINL